MYQRLKDYASVVAFMQRHVEKEVKMASDLVDSVAAGKLEKFMTWNGIELHEAAVYATEARAWLQFLYREPEGDAVEEHAQEQKFEAVRADTLRQIGNLPVGQTSGNGSMGHRITEKARGDFAILLYKGFNEGYDI